MYEVPMMLGGAQWQCDPWVVQQSHHKADSKPAKPNSDINSIKTCTGSIAKQGTK